MSLLALQRDFRAWLVDEDAGAARRLGVSAVPGLGVYQNNYRAQLVACLEETFARTRDWIGGGAFHEAVITHIARVPPNNWTLDAYPRDFPATLAMLYPDDAEVAELAWIDLALGEAFVGPDAVALTTEELPGVDWDTAILRLTPTLDLADLTTNATAIWSALAEGEVPPAVEALPQTGAILVWRQGLSAQFRAIDHYERQALLSARDGLSFAELCDVMVASRGETEGIARAGALLGRWVADGLIVATQ
ncbi:DNA-binding domain-containing protein [Sphingomonas naphthae]|uniref:DNA-binding domain-containing protein n=1 Tax=Sphingomonas naphthae TaxID=1813468 RepID=A0ABY7TNK1_9SPHN|nr:DNA-binding domain-containing protein [Sphingomonas naphthae]WCT74505.1 DNA-binding domain-containing protein [Sphingomonas naphthae]